MSNNNNNNNNNFSFVELNNLFNQGFINTFNNEETNKNISNINNDNNNINEKNKTNFKFKPNINMARMPIDNEIITPKINVDKNIKKDEDDLNNITKSFKEKQKKKN